MSSITDDFMKEMLRSARPYTMMILRRTRKRREPDADKVVWEHGRRLFELRRDKKLCIVCPVNDSPGVRGNYESDVSGIGIFSTGLDETKMIMDRDPAVMAGIFVYEIHPTNSFPGDSLAP